MSLIALLWSIVAALGVVLSGYLLWEAFNDLRALGELQNGRRALVRGRLASESIRLLVHGVFLLLGLSVLSRDIQPSPTVLALLLGNVGLIGTSIITVYVWRSVEMPASDSMTAEELVATAEATAEELLRKAEQAATDVVALARHTARELDRVEMQRTLNRRLREEAGGE